LLIVVMAKKRMTEREFFRREFIDKYLTLRKKYKKIIRQRCSLGESLQVYGEFQKLPRISTKVRLRNRCHLSGYSRSFYRDFSLSRQFFRELMRQGILPGIRKSSW
jgi:small subunit ribosomal protein S14